MTQMNASELQSIAKRCSPEQLVDLLNEWGSVKFYRGDEYHNDGFSHIKIGVESPTWQNKKKLKLLTDYIAKRGAFAKKQDAPEDVPDTVQQTMDALKETVRELTERVDAGEARINGLEEDRERLIELVQLLRQESTANKKSVGDGASAKEKPSSAKKQSSTPPGKADRPSPVRFRPL